MEELKKYLYKIFNDTPEATEEMTTSEYCLKHPEETSKVAYRLYYSNIAKSSIPFVKKAFEDFKKEQPEASKWLHKRLDINESSIAMGHSLLNGFKDNSPSYENRFKPKVQAADKLQGQMTLEAEKGSISEELKKQTKKPALKPVEGQ